MRLAEVRSREGTHTLVHADSGFAVCVSLDFAVSLDEQKAKGDVKKKGRLDPYAYVPLNRSKLNRRYGAGSPGTRAPPRTRRLFREQVSSECLCLCV